MYNRPLSRNERSTSSMWSTLHSILGNVPHRFIIHWRGNARFYTWWIIEFFKNANGEKKNRILRNQFNLACFHSQIAHVIREIRHFQQTPYKIDHISKVTAYLLDTSLLLDDDEMYHKSLRIEPRSSRLSAPNVTLVWYLVDS